MDATQYPLCHSVAFKIGNRSYVQIGNVHKSDIFLAICENEEDYANIAYLEKLWNERATIKPSSKKF